MQRKSTIQLQVVKEFILKWWGKFLTLLPFFWKFIKVWWKKFIIWRKARLVRYRGLVWYRKIANIFITSIVLFLLYLFIVDINFLWLFGKSPGLQSINNPNQSTASIIYTSDGKVLGNNFLLYQIFQHYVTTFHRTFWVCNGTISGCCFQKSNQSS